MKLKFMAFALSAIALQSHAYECSFDNIASTTPTEKFLDAGTGVITDLRFGLMWSACTFGQTFLQDNGSCSGDGENMETWSDALSSQNILNENEYAGYQDWRLPNIKELSSIVERACRNPAIRADIFPDSINAVYWTNTVDSDLNVALKGRVIDFADGSEFFKATSTKLYVRHVRSIN